MKLTNISEKELVLRDGLDADVLVKSQETVEVPDGAADRLMAVHAPDLVKEENAARLMAKRQGDMPVATATVPSPEPESLPEPETPAETLPEKPVKEKKVKEPKEKKAKKGKK